MGKGSAASGSASGSAGYSANGTGCPGCATGYSAGPVGYSGKTVCPGIKSMYGGAAAGIEARLTISPLTADGAEYQPLSQQLYQPLSQQQYLSLEGQMGEPYLACPECGSEVHYGATGSEISPLAVSALLMLLGKAVQGQMRDMYRTACPACMTGEGRHTCGR